MSSAVAAVDSVLGKCFAVAPGISLDCIESATDALGSDTTDSAKGA